MPLQPWMQSISIDDHLIEHPKVWSDRLTKKMWQYEGRIDPYIGLNAVAGKKPEEYGIEPVRYDDMIPGCYYAKARVTDMASTGSRR